MRTKFKQDVSPVLSVASPKVSMEVKVTVAVLLEADNNLGQRFGDNRKTG